MWNVRFIFVFLVWGLLAHTALGQDAVPRAPVDERLDVLDKKIRVLERRLELDGENAATRAKEAAVLGAGKDGFTLKSADQQFTLKLGGYIQADARIFLRDQDRPATTTFLLRRVRPIVEGTVAQLVDFRIMPDFGGGQTVLQDAYVNLRYWPWAKLQVGKFKPPVGLERLQSGANLLFVERALPTNLVPNRDVGIQWHGELWDGALAYAVGLFNGVPDGGSLDGDTDDGKDIAARLFILPFQSFDVGAIQRLGLGVAATSGRHEGTPAAPNLPSLRTSGQQAFFSYRINSPATAAGTVIAAGQKTRLSPQVYDAWGPLGILGEYVRSSEEVALDAATARLIHTAWQVATSYALSGENASYKGLKPKKVFDPSAGTWGAWEVVARYSAVRIDAQTFPVFANPATSAREAKSWGGGLNWYLNRNLKLAANYEWTRFVGGATSGDREAERVMLSRFQVAF